MPNSETLLDAAEHVMRVLESHRVRGLAAILRERDKNQPGATGSNA